MSPSPDFSAGFARWLRDPSQPVSLRFSDDGPGPWRGFEFSCHGDRVMARFSTAGSGPRPLALLLAEDAAAVTPLPGLFTATLDLPLLGTRRSPKWTERLSACLHHGPSSAADRTLLDAFLGQTARDLQCVIELCAGWPEVDRAAMGVAGVCAGALGASLLRALDPRVAVSVLAPGSLAPALDPDAALAAGRSRCRVLAAGTAGDRAIAWSERLGDGTPTLLDGDPLAAAAQRLAGELA